MKEVLAAFGAEVFRPIVTLLIPGFWALAPGLIALFYRVPQTWDFAKGHTTGTSLIFITVCTAMGMVLENFGGRMENLFFALQPDPALSDWYRYLMLALDPEPVAFDYIRSYVLRLKFEAGMCAGGVFALIGIPFIPWGLTFERWAIAVAVALTVILGYETWDSVKELANIRRAIFMYLPLPPDQTPRPAGNNGDDQPTLTKKRTRSAKI